MTSCSCLRIDSFIYLQITSSDCSSEAGKAITSAERKAGNKNYSFALGILFYFLCMGGRLQFYHSNKQKKMSNTVHIFFGKGCWCSGQLEEGESGLRVIYF